MDNRCATVGHGGIPATHVITYTFPEDRNTPVEEKVCEPCGHGYGSRPALQATVETIAENTGRKLGEGYGRDAGTWIFDGNTTEATYREIIRGIDEGDPAVTDRYNPPNMSGEYAGDERDELADELASALGHEPAEADTDEAETAFNDAASSAFWGEVERSGREALAGIDAVRAEEEAEAAG
jgi:hypothetical protein